MNNLNTVLTRMTEMMNAYEGRCTAAAERIITLDNTLQQEKAAMTAAAAADDMDAYRECEAKVRFLTARIQASKKEETEPLFSTQTEAISAHKEINAAIDEAIRPIYARLKDNMAAQDALLQELRNIANLSRPVSYRLSKYALKVGYFFSPWDVPASIIKYVESERYNAQQTIDRLLNK